MRTRYNPFGSGSPAVPVTTGAPRKRSQKPRTRKSRRTSVSADEALARATQQTSMANYPTIFEGFAAKGIPEDDVKPRENVFTFGAWRALGRTVRKGEKGVRICTMIPCGKKVGEDPQTGEVHEIPVTKKTMSWRNKYSAQQFQKLTAMLVRDEPLPRGTPRRIAEWRLQRIVPSNAPDILPLLDTEKAAAEYWRRYVAAAPWYREELEQMAVITANTRLRATGHYLVSHGIMNAVLVHPREVFRLAIIAGASSIIMMHNHPSGDPSPSEPDIRLTRDMIKSGELPKIPLTDHIIVGHGTTHTSMRNMGYFHP